MKDKYELEEFINKIEITPKEKKILNKILTAIENDDNSCDFINPAIEQIHDQDAIDLYLEIIKHKPMDLKTAKKKLKEDEYKTIKEFIDDIDLIWKNCFLYNEAGSIISNKARNCQDKFKNLLLEYFEVYVEEKIKEKNELINILNTVSQEQVTEILLKIKNEFPENIKLEEKDIEIDFNKISSKFIEKIQKLIKDK